MPLNGRENPLSKQIIDLYAFMFRHLVEAHQTHDTKKLNEVIHLLEIECETWQQLCEKHGTQQRVKRPICYQAQACRLKSRVKQTEQVFLKAD